MKTFFETVMQLVQEEKARCGSFRAMCEPLGLNSTTVQKWFTEKKGEKPRAPGIDQVGIIMDAIGVQAIAPSQSVRDFVRLFQLQNNMAGSIQDLSAQLQRNSDISFKPYILDQLSYDHSRLALYIVSYDETMSPILRKGDQVIINMAQTQIEDGELYLIQKDKALWIRRIVRDYDKIKLFTESKYLEPMTVEPDEFTIVGKVVWIGHFC